MGGCVPQSDRKKTERGNYRERAYTALECTRAECRLFKRALNLQSSRLKIFRASFIPPLVRDVAGGGGEGEEKKGGIHHYRRSEQRGWCLLALGPPTSRNVDFHRKANNRQVFFPSPPLPSPFSSLLFLRSPDFIKCVRADLVPRRLFLFSFSCLSLDNTQDQYKTARARERCQK